MKVTTVLATFAMVASLNAAVIEQVIVRQQWPWSTDVKVEYKLSGVTSPVDISVKAFNGNVELDSSRLAASMTGDRFGIAEDGVGTIIIDPVKAFGTSKIALANFKVKLSLSESKIPNSQDVLYRILDLEANPVTYEDVRRADFYNGKYGDFVTDFTEIGKMIGSDDFTTSLDDVFIWTGVTNNPAYKTTKLVLRKIKAKDRHFYMGAGELLVNGETVIPAQYTCSAAEKFRVKVSFTNDYWIGVFEVTEKQYALLTGTDASSISADVAVKPRAGIKYSEMRGTPSEWSSWPANVYEVTSDSILQTIRNRIPGMMVDLPTEAQWEYASRAGTDTQLYCGRSIVGSTGHKSALSALAWSSETTVMDDESNGMAVGQLLPNAFGLYDTLGNAAELVRDVFNPDNNVKDSSGKIVGPAPLAEEVEEPMGWTDGAAASLQGEACMGMYRGGSCARIYSYNHSASRRVWKTLNSLTGEGPSGFRLWIKGE